MSSLTIRNAKFQNGAQYEIIWPFLTIRNGKLEVVEFSKYFVKEDKKQNTITVYSKFQDTETLKIVKESKKNLKVYDHDNRCFGEVKISMTQCCNYGVAKEVEIQDKNGMPLCTLSMTLFQGGRNKQKKRIYEIKDCNSGNNLGNLIMTNDWSIEWNKNEEIDPELKALMLGSAFLIMESHARRDKIVLILCVVIAVILGIISAITKLIVHLTGADVIEIHEPQIPNYQMITPDYAAITEQVKQIHQNYPEIYGTDK